MSRFTQKEPLGYVLSKSLFFRFLDAHYLKISLVLAQFHFGTCMCSNVETNLSRTFLVSGPMSFEHPFCFAL